MDIDENQDKGTVDTNMLLNDNVPAEGTVEGEQEAVNADEEIPQQETDNGSENAQQETDNGSVNAQQETELTQNENNLATQDEAGEGIPDSVEKGDEDVGNEDTKPGDLDIESMLAAIHNDNPPPTSEDAQNMV